MADYGNIDTAMAGMIAEGIEGKRSIKDGVVQDSNGIQFGAPVMAYLGDVNKEVYPMILDTAKVVFDADFDGTDALSITVNGVESATVTYATSHANTMNLLVAALQALTGVTVYEADATEDANNRTLYIRTKGATCTVSVTEKVATIPGSTITYETDQVFLGIAMHTQKNLSTANTALYEQYEMANILEYGTIYALSTGTIQALQALYMSVTAGATLGRQTATAGKTVGTVAKADNTVVQTSTTITKIEVHGQYKLYAERAFA